MNKYDVAVVGGGPGGYVAAIRAAKLGLKVALVEGSELGGTCLNRGCIPSKTLLHMAEMSETIRHAEEWGIAAGQIEYNWKSMLDRQNQVMQTLRSGIAGLLKANKITHIRGWATVSQNRDIEITGGEENTAISADKVIIATGSKPFVPPIPGLADVPYHTSDTIFQLDSIPSTMIIIGGGVIGVEFAAIFSAFGTKVTVIEAADRIIPLEDEAVSKALAKALKQRGVTLITGAKAEKIEHRQGLFTVATAQNGQTAEHTAEVLLSAVGRSPNLKGVDGLGLSMNGRFVAVNEYMETSQPGIYAIGDLTGGYQLAHMASAEALVAAANAAGKREVMNYRIVPRCIYTHPEIASVGLTEQEAKEQGIKVKVQTYSLKGNGKALSMGETEGFVKLIADELYGEIIGVTMIGPHVTEMITTASAFIHLEGTMNEWAGLIHPHPTVSESFFEAANGWFGMGVNH